MRLFPVLAVVVGTALAYSALSPTTPSPPPKKPDAPVGRSLPLRSAFLLDVTGSRDRARIAASVDDFTPLFERLETTGGEVGFGTIREDSDRPFLRCFIPAPPEPPTSNDPPTSGNVFINANNKRREDDDQRKYAQKRRAWEADAKARINAFKLAIQPLIDAPATAPATDLTAAIERGDLMLSEPSAFTNASMAIVLITDGFHNAYATTTPTLRSKARVLIVNGIGSLGAISKMKPEPLRFESTEAAVRYISNGGGPDVQ
jgi:hypothetical protein